MVYVEYWLLVVVVPPAWGRRFPKYNLLQTALAVLDQDVDLPLQSSHWNRWSCKQWPWVDLLKVFSTLSLLPTPSDPPSPFTSPSPLPAPALWGAFGRSAPQLWSSLRSTSQIWTHSYSLNPDSKLTCFWPRKPLTFSILSLPLIWPLTFFRCVTDFTVLLLTVLFCWLLSCFLTLYSVLGCLKRCF